MSEGLSRRQRREARRTADQYNEDLRFLLEIPQFRRVIANWKAKSGTDRVSAFTGNSGTFYNLGVQDFFRTRENEMKAASLQAFRRIEDEMIAAAEESARANAPTDDDAE